MKKKVSFSKNAKQYDGLSIKTKMILNIFKLYTLRPLFVISNVNKIIPKIENRKFIYEHFHEIYEKMEKEKTMIRLFSHIQSGFIQHPLQIIPLLNSLKKSF